MRKIAAAIASAGLVTGVGAAAALSSASAEPAPKITICHGTGSASNPYVRITVSENSFKNGHFHNGVAPGHGPGHADNPDYIVDGDDECGLPPGSTTTSEATTTTSEATTTTMDGPTTTIGET